MVNQALREFFKFPTSHLLSFIHFDAGNRRSYDLTALVPISDEEDVEDEDEEQNGSIEEHDIEEGEGKKTKRLQSKCLNSDIPDNAIDQPKRRRGKKTQDATKTKRQSRTRSSGDIQGMSPGLIAIKTTCSL